MLQAAGAVVLAVLLFLALWDGFETLAEARRGFLTKQSQLAAMRARAESLPLERTRLAEALQEWEAVKKIMGRSAETGIVLADMEKVAKRHNALPTSIEPGAPVSMFYRGHLRAVPVKIRLQGRFPGVLETLQNLEALANPGELRSVSIKSAPDQPGVAPGAVEVEALLLLYSLSPPQWEEKVRGVPAGRYDAFWPLLWPKQEGAPEEMPTESTGQANTAAGVAETK